MAVINTETIRSDSEFDEFFNLLLKVVPDDRRCVILKKRDELSNIFYALPFYKRPEYLALLRSKKDKIPDLLLHSSSFEAFLYKLELLICQQLEENVEKTVDHSTGRFSNIGCTLRLPHLTPGFLSNIGFPLHRFSRNTDLPISVPGPSSGFTPKSCIIDRVIEANWLTQTFDFFNGKLGLARVDPTWFKTLLGINGGVIITLISKSTRNNPQSLSTEIMESFTALSAVVGFSASLAGLYLSTNKPKILPFGYDPEVYIQNLGIVGGLATVSGFTGGVPLLLPNNLFRWVTMGLAGAAFLIPISIKLLH